MYDEVSSHCRGVSSTSSPPEAALTDQIYVTPNKRALVSRNVATSKVLYQRRLWNFTQEGLEGGELG